MATSWRCGPTSLPGLIVTTSKATHALGVIAVVACVVIIAIHRTVAWVLGRLYDARLVVVEDDFSHPLK
jgi:hypothetical protein